MTADFLLYHIDALYTMDPKSTHPLGLIENAAIAFKDRQICYIGDSANAPFAQKSLNAKGMIALPGLVDCHTHAIYGGSRSQEFAQRLAGVEYSQILEQGGGIHSTVRSTRASTDEQLLNSLRQRLQEMVHQGVTTVEIKSGYGLNTETEVRCLALSKKHGIPLSTVSTYLAHTIPTEWQKHRDAYIDNIISEQLPACQPWAQSVDVYCDRGAFTLDEAVAILQAGKDLGLQIRAHAEQVTHTGISGIAAQMGASCVDHLERATSNDIIAMAEKQCIGVLLPGAQLYLRDIAPPIGLMREYGIQMAVASDLNPGTSPIHDLWTCATLACILQRLTIDEAIKGITRNAGLALGFEHLGWLGLESAADCILLRPPAGEAPCIESVIQHLGAPKVVLSIKNGRPITVSQEIAKGIV